MKKTYIAIDLKSFYASVECVERGLDPLTTNLVVADTSRTEKTICLAVSPSLKSYGISGRARLFEVVQKMERVNWERKKQLKNKKFSGSSYSDLDLKENPSLEVSYLIATPRMAHYMKYSARIYEIYLKYIAPEDIHVYSIDEVFMDVTSYLNTYQMDAKQLAMTIIKDVLETTGITATAGIGTNLYLAKVAMDIVAKRIQPDQNGVRIASLDEMEYRKLLWTHRPLTDFWRVGKGYAKKLEENGLYTMGDIARCSLGKEKSYHNEALLYELFGVNAELLIDHAWGYEPCTIKDIKSYQPENNSVGSGQVLHEPYTYKKARLIVQEMVDLLVLDLVEQQLMTNQIVLTVGYDMGNVTENYHGEVSVDFYGRKIPKHAHGTANLKKYTSSTKLIMVETMKLFDRIVNKNLLVRRVNISASHVKKEVDIKEEIAYEQLDLFALPKKEEKVVDDAYLEKEKNLQKALLDIKKKYGKSSVIKGMNLEEGATTLDRNKQIGGHKA